MYDEMKIKRKASLLEQFELFDKYSPCLRAHAEEIVNALQYDDLEALIAVFKACEIPKKAWLTLAILLKRAYDSDFQSWSLGPT